MKGLMKECSGGSVMWRGWRGIGSPRELYRSYIGVYIGECAGSRSVKECLKKIGLGVR